VSDVTRARLAALLAGPRPDVAEANLLVACEADPEVDVAGALAEVDGFAAAARSAGGTADAVVEVLGAEGFVGDRREYDDPANSFLHEVLRRRRGLPILLSALTVAVGERVGAPIEGVGLPGHFVVADRSGVVPRYLDAFDGWAELDEAAVAGIVRTYGGGDLTPAHVATVGTAGMVRRMLVNLRGSYLGRRRLADALWTVELEALVDPDDPMVRVQERALLIGLGRYDDAEASAVVELACDPPPDLRRETESQLRAIEDLRRRMN
jgi:regulator of sirC expression with transglutaminase-like and TPR domain